MTEQELRIAVKEAGVRLLETGLTQGTWGNISVRLDDKRMLVTPSGMDYVRMRPEDLVVVDIETLEWSGDIKPTSEKKIHAAIYRERPEICAIIHSHPVWSSAVAASRKTMPAFNDELKTLVGGDVECGAYGLPGTKTLTNGAIGAIKGKNACFMANHGLLACAKDMDGAFEVCRVLEESSKQYVSEKAGEILGKHGSISTEDILEAFGRVIESRRG